MTKSSEAPKPTRAKVFLTPEQIVEIYTRKKKGQKNRKIERDMTLRPGAITTCMRCLRRYLPYGRNSKRNKYKNYIQAAEEIRKIIADEAEKKKAAARVASTEVMQAVSDVPVSLPDAEQTHSFNEFEAAILRFQEATNKFIAEQVFWQVREVKEENEKLKRENDKMTEAFNTAKNSNWVDNLKKRFLKPAIQS